jgi:hypothetical protein
MDVKIDQGEIEQAVMMWLENKHGISITKVSEGAHGGSKAQWMAMHSGATVGIGAVTVTFTNVRGAPLAGPYRTPSTT